MALVHCCEFDVAFEIRDEVRHSMASRRAALRALADYLPGRLRSLQYDAVNGSIRVQLIASRDDSDADRTALVDVMRLIAGTHARAVDQRAALIAAGDRQDFVDKLLALVKVGRNGDAVSWGDAVDAVEATLAPEERERVHASRKADRAKAHDAPDEAPVLLGDSAGPSITSGNAPTTET